MRFRDAHIGIGIVLIGLMIIILSLMLKREPAPIIIQPLPKQDRMYGFEERWRLAGMTVPLVHTEPRRVPVETIVAPAIIVEGATTAERVSHTAQVRRTVKKDVCRGRGKVWINKHKWRCKK